jgi:hypothetical protein
VAAVRQGLGLNLKRALLAMSEKVFGNIVLGQNGRMEGRILRRERVGEESGRKERHVTTRVVMAEFKRLDMLAGCVRR